MKEYSNICPACKEVVNYEDELTWVEGEFLKCAYCGYVDEASFWEVQNIELLIAINAPWERMLTGIEKKLYKYADWRTNHAEENYIMKDAECCANCVVSLPDTDNGMVSDIYWVCTKQGYKQVNGFRVCNQFRSAWDE